MDHEQASVAVVVLLLRYLWRNELRVLWRLHAYLRAVAGIRIVDVIRAVTPDTHVRPQVPCVGDGSDGQNENYGYLERSLAGKHVDAGLLDYLLSGQTQKNLSKETVRQGASTETFVKVDGSQ